MTETKPQSDALFVGRIREIWRYPVKSMQGERLLEAQLRSDGVVGDRAWAMRDERSGEISSARRLPGLLAFEARHEDTDTGEAGVRIRLPDGSTITSADRDAAGRAIADQLGTPVTLWPRRPASDRAHYRKRRTMRASETRELLGLEPDEDFPDLSSLPLTTITSLARYVTPPGTYVDACPLHLLTTASLATMAAHAPEADFDVRRFRPNFLIETAPEIEGLAEDRWVGRRLRVGDTVIGVQSRTVRCSIPAREQPGLEPAPEVARTVSRHNGRHLGAYASVEAEGTLSVGDEVWLQPTTGGALGEATAAGVDTMKRAALTVARKILR